eukprot:CAMPEP_0170450668 /NCGR_PEP_ID=MMETSP0123-20130129/131_1 /TAXON_ID=182087 /ORGANISM="Favella ehrenbergii, Strain Fehren 1" /LENGTH=83 /DNA_ID=CAMNT_0010712033 /DNA_START=1182 /DNA_END=1433 /DNA_ORIENTATION=+
MLDTKGLLCDITRRQGYPNILRVVELCYVELIQVATTVVLAHKVLIEGSLADKGHLRGAHLNFSLAGQHRDFECADRIPKLLC